MENNDKNIAEGLLKYCQDSSEVLSKLERQLKDLAAELPEDQRKKIQEEINKIDIAGAKSELDNEVKKFKDAFSKMV